jgi:hypothetical protein
MEQLDNPDISLVYALGLYLHRDFRSAVDFRPPYWLDHDTLGAFGTLRINSPLSRSRCSSERAGLTVFSLLSDTRPTTCQSLSSNTSSIMWSGCA